ncbi:MAG: PhoPQ-activated protein PqaA family protein, partial [Planctomycetota bacterium]|jgi:PhoPQ-activated pathogenicity-related protein/creatinine amidohydrolase/Fe(II)-dependent formamide hydrolase-like protein
LVVLAVLFAALPEVVFGTALDDYVKKPDASYKYSLVNTIEGKGYTAYVIDMTSQSWRSKEEVDRTLWKHWLTIIKPDKVTSDTGLLWINGGSNDNDAPKNADMMMVQMALGSGTVVADLRMVPNQPLNFPDGGRPRYEDAIIAYTFDKCIVTGDQTWALLLPMVKSAVRAMDTVQKHVATASNGIVGVKKFVVSGASKRGWTTWLTAAVDKRVAAIAPAVIDVLNMKESMRHHFSAYGFYAPAIRDYEEMKIFNRLGTAGGEAMRKLVDPYEYRSRYKMPKFLISSTGDQFFLPDSAQFYYDDLPGRKYLRYIPNTDHGLDFSAAASLLLFYQSILKDTELPKFTWKVRGDKIRVKPTSGKLKEVNLWQASNEKARDFRTDTIGRVWKRTPLKVSENGVGFDARVDEPKKGWTAFFVEMVYDSGGPVPYKFTTQVHVVPQRLPFAEKISGDKISISVVYRGASVADVEEKVINRIEKALATVGGIKRVTSKASDGAGRTIIEVSKRADATKVLKDVKAKIKSTITFYKNSEKPAINISIVRDEEKKKERGSAKKAKKVGAKGSVKKRKAEKVLYAELTPQEFRERVAAVPIAYLPLGTLEWHGEHLPIGSDGLQSYHFFIELAREAGGIVLPMLFLGPDRIQKVDGKELYGMDLCRGMSEKQKYPDQQLAGSAYWVPEETFRTIIEATLKQLKRAGFKIVVGHGHGPSTGFFNKHRAQWKEKFGLETFTCWGSEYDRQGLGIMVDHAAMNETSLVMALRPELVQMYRLPKVEAGWPVGVGGRDPRVHASAKVGQKAIKLQKERMAKILLKALETVQDD